MAQDIKKINRTYMVSQEIAGTRFADYADLEAYYKLEDVSDSSGNGRTLTNNGTTTFAAAKFSNGADLGASNSTKYLSINNNLGINYGGAQSAIFWVKLSTEIGTGAYQFFDRRNANTSGIQQIQYQYNGGTRRLCWERYNDKNGNNPKFYYNLTMGTTNWYQIAYVYDGTNMYGYVNGILVGQLASTAYDGLGTGAYANGFAIGAWVGGGNYTSGIFDDYAVFSRALTSDEIYSLYKTGVKKLNGQVNLNPELESTSLRGDANLVQYTRFEGNSTATVGGNGTDANITYSTANGKFGQGAGFNGSSSKITIADAAALRFPADCSVSVWVNVTSIATSALVSLLCKYDTGGTYGAGGWDFRLYNDAGAIILSWYPYPASAIASYTIPSFATGSWYHLVGTYDGANLKVYVNGVLGGTTANTTDFTANTKPLEIGHFGNLNPSGEIGRWLNGKMDEIALFSRALSSTEISNLYNTNIKKYNGVSNV